MPRATLEPAANQLQLWLQSSTHQAPILREVPLVAKTRDVSSMLRRSNGSAGLVVLVHRSNGTVSSKGASRGSRVAFMTPLLTEGN